MSFLADQDSRSALLNEFRPAFRAAYHDFPLALRNPDLLLAGRAFIDMIDLPLLHQIHPADKIIFDLVMVFHVFLVLFIAPAGVFRKHAEI